jgi:hypothetical protein
MNIDKLPDRRAYRHSLRMPLRLRIWGSSDPEHRAESINLSQSGVLLETDLRLGVGTEVDLHLKLLEEITGQPTTEWRCRGRVVRILPEVSANGASKVGVHFEWLDAMRF